MRMNRKLFEDSKTQLDFADTLPSYEHFSVSASFRKAALYIAETALADALTIIMQRDNTAWVAYRNITEVWFALIASNCTMPLSQEVMCQLSDSVDMLRYLYANPDEITEDNLSYFTLLGRAVITEVTGSDCFRRAAV